MEMPHLIPIQIPTKGKNIFKRLWAWRMSARLWKLADDWEYVLWYDKSYAVKIIIPKNFIFDAASIPRFLWNFLSPTGLLLIPGLIHDFGYRYDFLWELGIDGDIYRWSPNSGKSFWDNIFKEVSIDVNGMSYISMVAWLAIKLFGFIAWNANRRRNAEEIRPMRLGYNLNFKKKGRAGIRSDGFFVEGD